LVEARDLEEASFALIENGGKNAWRVELRKATPVDRTIHAHQRDRVQVADDAIGLDRLIDHFDIRLSEMAFNAVRGSFSTFRHKISIQKGGIGGLVLGEVSSGCWPCETPPVAPHVEMSPSNCCSESQIILHTRHSTPCGRIVFSTFRACRSTQAGSTTAATRVAA